MGTQDAQQRNVEQLEAQLASQRRASAAAHKALEQARAEHRECREGLEAALAAAEREAGRASEGAVRAADEQAEVRAECLGRNL